MPSNWVLITVLNGIRTRSVWQSQEGAIADRERQLRARREKDPKSPTGWRTIWPIGWTSIGRAEHAPNS